MNPVHMLVHKLTVEAPVNHITGQNDRKIFQCMMLIIKLTAHAHIKWLAHILWPAHILREVVRRNLIHCVRRSTESEPPTMQTIALNISSIHFTGLKHVQPELTVREESGV